MERSTVHLLHKRGKSLREIASELGRSKSTIARALSEPVDRPASGRQRKSNVDPFREQIGEWLKQGLSCVRMMELAREDPAHPYRGCWSVWRGFTYDAASNPLAVNLPNGLQRRYSFDSANRPLRVEHWLGSTQVEGVDYTLDANGEIG